MRPTPSLRLLFIAATLIAAACGEADSPLEPPGMEAPKPEVHPAVAPLAGYDYWADGYLRSRDKLASSSTPEAGHAWSRSGGRMTIIKVAGTTGRYIARFGGLTALLGGASTVHVTGLGEEPTYCQPAGDRLVRDSVQVRCYKVGTGAAANALFSLQVLGKRGDRAFAYANQPTATDYAPAPAGSWNPTGATRVRRFGVGVYVVTFTGLGSKLSFGIGGHAQANAVGTGKAHCKIYEWGSGSDVAVEVRCYTRAGAPADSKFTVIFTPPAAHLAYAWADQPSTPLYATMPTFTYNPSGFLAQVFNYGTGTYQVTWPEVDGKIRGSGNVQVTAWGEGNAQCKTLGTGLQDVSVRCFAPDGSLVDSYYTVLLGS